MSLTNHSYTTSRYDENDNDLEKIAKFTVLTLLITFGIFGSVFVLILAAKYTDFYQLTTPA